MSSISRSKKPAALTLKVVDYVLDQIKNGDLEPGAYVISEREMSKLLDVSRVTVRRALEILVLDKTLKREAGRGYFFDGEKMNSEKGNAIVFLHSQTDEDLLMDWEKSKIWEGARLEAESKGLVVMVQPLGEKNLSKSKAVELAKIARAVVCDFTDKESVKNLIEADLPVVRLGYYHDLPVDDIIQDDYEGIAKAYIHLWEKGHERIGYMDNSGCLQNSPLRMNLERRKGGYFSAVSRTGGEYDPALVVNPTLDELSIKKAIESLLKNGCTALILPHLELLTQVQLELDRMDRVDGVEFGLVVWGQSQKESKKFPTHLSWDQAEMGRESVRRLVQRLGSDGKLGTLTVNIPVRLVDRGTAGQGPSAKRKWIG